MRGPYLAGQIEHVDFCADHAEGLGAGVYVVEPRFDGAHVAAEFLVDTVVGLRDNFVGIIDETAAKTRHPSPCTSTAFSPAVHAPTVEGHLSVMLVSFQQVDVLGFARQPVRFLYHRMIISIHLNTQT